MTTTSPIFQDAASAASLAASSQQHAAPSLTASSVSTLSILLYIYLSVEVIFYLTFAYYIVPRANRRTKPHPYRDYGKERHKLLIRILDRLERTCRYEDGNDAELIPKLESFLWAWFYSVDSEGSAISSKQQKQQHQQQQQQQQRQELERMGALVASSEGLEKSCTGNDVPILDHNRNSILVSDELLPPPLKLVSQYSSCYPPSESGSRSDYDDDEIDENKVVNAESESESENDENSNNDHENNNDNNNTVASVWSPQWLSREGMDQFLCWAFFDKHPHELLDWEQEEFTKLYDILSRRYGFKLKQPPNHGDPAGSGTTDQWMKPRLLTLDDCNPLHRLLLVYAIIGLLSGIAGIVLRFMGFKRFVTRSGLVYWYRPESTNDTPDTSTTSGKRHNTNDRKKHNQLPLLFFHGIAPAGLTFYLPMVLCGLCNDGRATFLFENKSISYSICFDAITEEETTHGVTEALERHLAPNTKISLCGHSFGSCQLTWLLHAPEVRKRIRQFVLLDPVTILLSEPDVMVNFLHGKSGLQEVEGRMKGDTKVCKGRATQSSWTERLMESVRHAKIRLVASSDIFTEHYLRRHFSWYNSELWLEDIPPDVTCTVCIAECDEIVDAAKVKREIEIHNDLRSKKSLSGENINEDRAKVEMIHWNNVGHAYCITSSTTWREVKDVMVLQEGIILKDDALQ